MSIVALARHGKAVSVYTFIGHFHSYTGQAALLPPSSLDKAIQPSLIGSCNRAFRLVQLLLLRMEHLPIILSLTFGPCQIDGKSISLDVGDSTDNDEGW